MSTPKTKPERVDAPWWNPFASRTVFCPRTQGTHVCDKPLHTDYKHTCSCGFRWAA